MTKDQARAKLAFEHVSKFAPGSTDAKKYASIVHKLPTLIHTAGLCQALHFIDTRSSHQRLYAEDLAKQLQRIEPKIKDVKTMLDHVRNAGMVSYLQLTQETLACAMWYRRLVQGVLKIEHGDADRGSD